MFKTDGEVNADKMKEQVSSAEKNYVIQPNDYLDITVYANNGEIIFDPNFTYRSEIMSGGGTGGSSMRGGAQSDKPNFLVQQNGEVKLPMIGYVKVDGLTLLQADSVIQEKFAEFYVDPFSITKVANNRIIVLGSTGGQVIPMSNDNMNLLEVLAMAGGIDKGGKAFNIRLIRGDLNDPMVQIIDLTTIEGMQKASLAVRPNDVIYVEPVRRVFFEALADLGPIFGTVGGILTTYVVIKDFIR